jgi:hypothetical protein
MTLGTTGTQAIKKLRKAGWVLTAQGAKHMTVCTADGALCTTVSYGKLSPASEHGLRRILEGRPQRGDVFQTRPTLGAARKGTGTRRREYEAVTMALGYNVWRVKDKAKGAR